MKKLTYLLALLVLSFSCMTEENIELKERSSLDLSNSRMSNNLSLEESVYFPDLSSDCDLSMFSIQDISDSTSFFVDVPNVYMNPSSYNWAQSWGEYPSNDIAKELTYVLWGNRYTTGSYGNGLLPAVAPDNPINPETGLPYHMSVRNSYYNVYYIADGVHPDENYPEGWTHDYLESDISSYDATILRDKISCFLVDKASDLGETTHIVDIVVAGDMILYNPYSCNVCINTHLLVVYVKWGHHV